MKRIIKNCLIALGGIIIVPGFALIILYATSPTPEQYHPSAEDADGHGSVNIADDHGTAGSGENILTLKFRTGSGGIRENGGLKVNLGHVINVNGSRRIYVPFDMSPAGRCSSNSNIFENVKVATDNPSVVIDASVPSGFELFRKYLGLMKYSRSHETADMRTLLRSLHLENTLKIRVLNGELSQGDLVTMTMQGRSYCSGIEMIVRTDGNGNGTYGLIPEIAVPGSCKKAARFNVVTRFNPDPGVPVDLLVAALQDNPVPARAENYKGTIHFSTDNPVAGLPAQYTFRAGDRGVKRFSVRFPERGLYRISVIDGAGVSGISHYIDTRKHDKKIFFGDIHIQSVFSMYGERSPEDIYENRRDVHGLDFCCISDRYLMYGHDIEKLHVSETESHKEEYRCTQGLSDRYCEPGQFVTLQGYELFSPSGCSRIIFPDPLMKRSEPYFMNGTAGKSVTISDIHGYDSGGTAPLEPGARGKSGLMEIYGSMGSLECGVPDRERRDIPFKGKVFNAFISAASEGRDLHSGGHMPCSAQHALALGYRFGFTGSGYSAGSACGNTVPARGLTAAYSRDFHRKGIYKSLQCRNTYATTGSRIGLRFSCNGSPMGSEITAEDAPEIIAEILGNGPIRTVELVKHDRNGYRNIFELRVDTFTGASPSVSKNTASRYYANGDRNIVRLFYRDDSFACDSFYYLRITQENGNMAWSSPVWVNRKCNSGL